MTLLALLLWSWLLIIYASRFVRRLREKEYTYKYVGPGTITGIQDAPSTSTYHRPARNSLEEFKIHYIDWEVKNG